MGLAASNPRPLIFPSLATAAEGMGERHPGSAPALPPRPCRIFGPEARVRGRVPYPPWCLMPLAEIFPKNFPEKIGPRDEVECGTTPPYGTQD